MARRAPGRNCLHCGRSLDRIRWAKGKRLCPECGIARGLQEVALQADFAALTFEQRKAIMIAVHDGQFTMDAVPSTETAIEEE